MRGIHDPLHSQEEEEDLPHLWQKPAFPVLLAALRKLRVEPTVWGLKVSNADILKQQAAAASHHERKDTNIFLSSIIKSSLSWLETDEEREEIWEETSRRMTERCGRTAMGEIVRRWPFSFENGTDTFSLTIREPPLTGDSLGLKTWGSSYVLAQLLHEFAFASQAPLAHLATKNEQREVLELGSGTGLLGLTAACIWRTKVYLTDLPEIMGNLEHNASLNRALVEERGGKVETAPLMWGGSEEDVDPKFRSGKRYELIIVADPLYDDDHPALLAGAIDEQLARNADARVLVMVPQRDEITKGLLRTLRSQLGQQANPLACHQENIVAGEDDWGDGNEDDTQRVGFWWGIFGRDQSINL
ncbi:putative methyltransferase-domain-containing protein [Podospora australis]|uniref:Methyltransferase-domain-containing protein n=1 Tax=Podospora australis TaxID=1536484 RepID=A0AAN7ANC0_9PEZI|nr:putative methyltransferase-domain-containing protein [Podospora australis]